MLTQWAVMVLNCHVLDHLQQCKCSDQDLWAPLYVIVTLLRFLLGCRYTKPKQRDADNLIFTLAWVLCALQHQVTIFVTI